MCAALSAAASAAARSGGALGRHRELRDLARSGAGQLPLADSLCGFPAARAWAEPNQAASAFSAALGPMPKTAILPSMPKTALLPSMPKTARLPSPLLPSLLPRAPSPSQLSFLSVSGVRTRELARAPPRSPYAARSCADACLPLPVLEHPTGNGSHLFSNGR